VEITRYSDVAYPSPTAGLYLAIRMNAMRATNTKCLKCFI
jgi:hypothetical protein